MINLRRPPLRHLLATSIANLIITTNTTTNTICSLAYHTSSTPAMKNNALIHLPGQQAEKMLFFVFLFLTFYPF